MPKSKKKLKRAFIDIEFKDEKSLDVQLQKVKINLLAGAESQNKNTRYYNKSLLFNLRQWYVEVSHNFTEKLLDNQTVIKIKSKL